LADAWFNKGMVLDEQGEYEEAIKAYDKAIELNPEFGIAKELLSSVFG